jgi:hypothetical protein
MSDLTVGRTGRMLRGGGFSLLVSLPRNDAEMARAALDAGADGLKVHIGLEHFASGLRTGSLDDEQDALREICALGAPVGIVPGIGEGQASREEMLRLAEIGIDFFDLYATDMPAWMLRMDDCPLSVMVAFSATCRPWALIESVAPRSRPEMIEASIMPEEVAVLRDAGVAALLIGAVVTGTETASMAEATAQFRAAIEATRPQRRRRH